MLVTDHNIEKLLLAYPEIESSIVLRYANALNFKHGKTAYHLRRCEELLRTAQALDWNSNYQEEVLTPLSYEAEDVILSLKSLIDIILRMVITLAGLPLSEKEASVTTVSRLAERMRRYGLADALEVLSARRSYRMQFLHRVRNEIAHEVDLMALYPLRLEVQAGEGRQGKVRITFFLQGEQIPFLSFYQQCFSEVTLGIRGVIEALIAYGTPIDA